MLSNHAKKVNNKTNTTVTARIPAQTYSKFKAFCDSLGLSINEALNLLIENELKNEEQMNKEVIQPSIKVEEPIEEKPKPKPKFNYIEPTPRITYDEDGNEIIDETPDWQWEKINAHPSYFKPNEEE
jgi:antitoxin component of RelBE/YafQ-DinJ toxin-antitoxin module